MKLFHKYEDGNFVWVYSEPEFTLKELLSKKAAFDTSPRKHQSVELVDDDCKPKAWTAIVLVDRHGVLQIKYQIPNEGRIYTRTKDGGFTTDRRLLLKEAFDAIIHKKYGWEDENK